ncbi:uncharacterized protein LOC108675447, partial [Hyalella azteca]|uniref:Uncharacterized protein LOC108675447 n=1 Tax=Hyalella azteca TaxID=294128 RepID=A0A8B7NYV5_HYAAZ
MSRFAYFLVCSLIPSVLGAGGGGGHAVAESQADDVSDAANIKILNIDGATTFNCSAASGNKTRLVEWFKDGQHLETKDEVTVKADLTLVLDPTTEDHVGLYECRATTNEVLLTQEAIVLSYKKMPKSGTAIEGDKLTLT